MRETINSLSSPFCLNFCVSVHCALPCPLLSMFFLCVTGRTMNLLGKDDVQHLMTAAVLVVVAMMGQMKRTHFCGNWTDDCENVFCSYSYICKCYTSFLWLTLISIDRDNGNNKTEPSPRCAHEKYVLLDVVISFPSRSCLHCIWIA